MPPDLATGLNVQPVIFPVFRPKYSHGTIQVPESMDLRLCYCQGPSEHYKGHSF